MHLTIDSVFILILGISSFAFSARIARFSWEINQLSGSGTTEETFLKLYQAAGIIFIFCAVLMSFGILPLR